MNMEKLIAIIAFLLGIGCICWIQSIDESPLEVLSKNPDPGIREAVARNGNTPVNVLETLAKDEDPKVRLAVAQNPNTPVTVLDVLSNNEKF